MGLGNFDIDSVQVKSPCPAAWEKMTGEGAARFCSLCKHHVYDFSGMTRREAEALVVEKEGRLCVRFARRADGRVMTRDCSPVRASRARRKALMLATAGLAFVLTGSFSSIARWNPTSRWSYIPEFNRMRQSVLYVEVPFVSTMVDGLESLVERAFPQPEFMIMGVLM